MTTLERMELHQELSNQCHSVNCKSRMIELWEEHLIHAERKEWDGAVKTYSLKIAKVKTSRAVKKMLISVGEERLARYFYIKNY